MAGESRLLVSGDPGDRDARAEQLGLPDNVARRADLRQELARDPEEGEQLVVPLERVEREQERAGRVRGIGGVDLAARQAPDEPGVDGAEGEPVRPARLREQPLELRRREVGIGRQPGPCAEQLERELEATLGGPAILPDDRTVDRAATAALPEERRLALVRDPDRLELA